VATYLLTWNPEKFIWDNIQDCVDALYNTGLFADRWSCGNTKRITSGDRVFFMRQRIEPRGIFASGEVISASFKDEHWDPIRASKGDLALFVMVNFDTLLNPNNESILDRNLLLSYKVTSGFNWDTQSSGVSIPDQVAAVLEIMWSKFIVSKGKEPITSDMTVVLPQEITNQSNIKFFEGSKKKIFVNAYERNLKARKACLDHYGYDCSVCGMNFENLYGKLGKEYIQVHHIIPLHTINKQYCLDPINDLRPVCPNCHAMIHRYNLNLNIDELKKIMSEIAKARV
jgi:5-methylcytosine-specific restriction protein A